jgi:hypothetical protein
MKLEVDEEFFFLFIFCLMNTNNNMHQKNTSEKKKTMSPPMMTYEEKEKKNQQQLQPSSNPSTSQSLLDIEKKDTTRPNGTATTIGCGAASSLLNIVQMKENHSNRRRSDIYTNITLNEEIQKQTNSKEEKDVLIKPNRMPSIAPAQPSALLSKLSAFLPQMHEANLQLEEKIQKNPILAKREIEIDAVLDEEADDATDDEEEEEEEEEEGKPQIEMSLGMGVVDLKTAEAVEEVEKLVGGFANNEWNSKSEKTNDDAKGEEDEEIEKAHKKKKKKKIEVL